MLRWPDELTQIGAANSTLSPKSDAIFFQHSQEKNETRTIQVYFPYSIANASCKVTTL